MDQVKIRIEVKDILAQMKPQKEIIKMKKIILFTLIISNIIFASDQIPGKKQVKPIVITNAKFLQSQME